LRGERRGLSNGLSNGLRRDHRGRSNGLSNGVTNGFRNLRSGITNGITNGNGLINGIAPHKKVLERKGNGVRIFVTIGFFFILFLTPFLMTVDEVPDIIIIDGSFGDWNEVVMHISANKIPPFPQNIDIIDYRVDGRQMELSFYVKVEGQILAGEPDEPGGGKHVDTVYIFIDTDLDSDSGYFIEGLGADYMIEIYGWNGEVIGSALFSYTDLAQDWNFWDFCGSIKAAVTGSELEAQLSYSALYLQKQDKIDVLFYTQSYDRMEDFSERIISNENGILSVRQEAVGEGLINGSGKRLLRLDLLAENEEITISEIKLTRIGIGSDNDVSTIRLMDGTGSVSETTLSNGYAIFYTDIFLRQKESKTLYVEVDVDPDTLAGNSIGIRIEDNHDIRTDMGTVSLTRKKPRMNCCEISYLLRVPENITIDGAFLDWDGKHKQNDTSEDTNRKDIDILKYGVSTTDSGPAFYLKVNGEMACGIKVPYYNDKRKTEPIIGDDPYKEGPPPEFPPKTGEDIVYIFIDTKPGSGYDHRIPIGADYMIEVLGRHNKILSKCCYEWFGTFGREWKWMECGSVDVALDSSEMEIGIPWEDIAIDPQSDAFEVYFLTTDWERRGVDYSNKEGPITGPTRGSVFSVSNGEKQNEQNKNKANSLGGFIKKEEFTITIESTNIQSELVNVLTMDPGNHLIEEGFSYEADDALYNGYFKDAVVEQVFSIGNHTFTDRFQKLGIDDIMDFEPETVSGDIDENMVVYDVALTNGLNVTINYELFLDRVKEEIVLLNPPPENQDATYFIVSTLISWDEPISVWSDGVEKTNQHFITESSLVVRDEETNEFIAEHPEPYAYDSEGNKQSSQYEWIPYGDNQAILNVLTDWDWISDEERVYPIVIDPTRRFYPNPTSWDGYILSIDGSPTRHDEPSIFVGWEEIFPGPLEYTFRGFFYFDISTIPDTATITDVDFSFNVSVIGTMTQNIDINSLEDELSQSDQDLFDDIGDGTTYISNNNAFSTAGWKTRDLGSSADSDLQDELSVDNSWGVGMKRTTESGTSAKGEVWASDTDSDPYINVTYDLPIVINSTIFNPTGLPNPYEAVHIHNKDDGGGAVNIDGWEIGDNDGNSYTIPASLPDIPDGATLYIHFTTGTDDLDFSGDNEAHIYIGNQEWFEDEGDQCYLKDDEDLYADFVAWDSDGDLTSDQQDDDDDAVAAGMWDDGDYVDTENPGSGYEYIYRTDPDTDTDQPADWEVVYIPEFSDTLPPLVFVSVLFAVLRRRSGKSR
jgi:hypothetical protein